MTELAHQKLNVLNMGPQCLVGMVCRADCMALRRLGVLYRCFVASSFLIPGRLSMILRSARKMF
jgi:hypothetical protein